MDIKVEDTVILTGNSDSIFNIAVVKTENEVVAESGIDLDDTKLDGFYFQYPAGTSGGGETSSSNLNIPDSATVANAEDTHNFPQSTYESEIKVERVDVDSPPMESILPHTGSSLFIESEIIIKKEEDLGIDEEIAETLVGFTPSLYDEDHSESESSETVSIFDAESSETGLHNSIYESSILRSVLCRILQKPNAHSVSFNENISASELFPSGCSDLLSAEKPSNVNYCIKYESSQKSKKLASDTKFAEVRVVLEDLFPKSLRDKGSAKMHVDSKSCQCIYCTGKFKYKPVAENATKKTDNEVFAKPKEIPRADPKRFSSRCFSGIRCTDSECQSFIHTSERKYPCALCSTTFKFQGSLSKHIQSHMIGKLFPCPYCQAKFHETKDLKIHLMTHRGGKPTCSYCPAKFSRISELLHHLQIHTGAKPFLCRLCPAKFSQISSLKCHLWTHTAMKPFLCKYCPAKYSHRSGLESHLLTDSCAKPFTCSNCPSKFSQKADLVRHLRTHTGEKPFLCKLCPAKFSQSSSLKSHIRTHTGEKPFSCTFCPAKFSHRKGLQYHLNTHTGEKFFSCTFCPAKFRLSHHLKSHLLTHSGEKPFSCTFCPAKFRQKQHLKSHLNIHTNERPFACTYCPDKFRHRSNLRNHLHTHTNEKPFLCTYCSAKFTRNSQLKSHLKKHASEKSVASEESNVLENPEMSES